jgi:hypothetical protein
MKYGSVEYQYAAPIAQGLIEDGAFRHWVLSKSKFSNLSDARILHEEMKAHRRNPTAEWWRFYFAEGCRCQPKDKFKADGVQSPARWVCRTHHRDNHRFGDEQAWWSRQAIDPIWTSRQLWVRGYPLRAQCWMGKAHLKFVASQPCLVCGRSPADAHHLRYLNTADRMESHQKPATRDVAVDGAAELSNEALRLPRALPACALKKAVDTTVTSNFSAMATIAVASANASSDG